MALPRTGLLVPAGTAGEAGQALEEVLATAQAAEQRGFDALVLDGRPRADEGRWRSFDPFTLLGACAAATSAIRLGAIVSIGERPVSLVAKAVATLDVCSAGRAVLVLAPSGSFGGEPDAPASAEPPGVASIDDLAEALAIVAAMLATPAATVTGRRLAVRAAWNEPRRPVPPPIAVALGRPADGVLAAVAAWSPPPELVLVDRLVPPGAPASASGAASGAGPVGSARSGPPVLELRAAPRGPAGTTDVPPPAPGVVAVLGPPGGRGGARVPRRRSGLTTLG